MRKVFVVNDNGQDFSSAAEHGEIVVISHGMQPIFKLYRLSSTVEDMLKYYTEDDFLLLAGPNIINILCVIYLFEKFPAINVLLFDARSNKYVLRVLSKNVFEEGAECLMS